jgi:hypothetical protein
VTFRSPYAALGVAHELGFPSHRQVFAITALETLACGLQAIATSAPDNIAQRVGIQRSRSMLCEPTAECLVESIGRVLAWDDEAAGAVEAWLGQLGWNAVSERIAKTVLA